MTLKLLAYIVMYLEPDLVWVFLSCGTLRCLFQVHCLVLKIVLMPFSYIFKVSQIFRRVGKRMELM